MSVNAMYGDCRCGHDGHRHDRGFDLGTRTYCGTCGCRAYQPDRSMVRMIETLERALADAMQEIEEEANAPDCRCGHPKSKHTLNFCNNDFTCACRAYRAPAKQWWKRF